MLVKSERGLVTLEIAEFHALLAPIFERVGTRVFVLTEHPPRIELTEQWFGQGIYRRRGFNNRYAVLEMEDHFLVYAEGSTTQLWNQGKLGNRYFTPYHHTTITMRHDYLVEALARLNAKYP